jgi:hypothetical protein
LIRQACACNSQRWRRRIPPRYSAFQSRARASPRAAFLADLKKIKALAAETWPQRWRA